MKQWELSRRAFLRGTGIALALPVLDVMAPSIARAAAGAPLRTLFYYVPNGQLESNWLPTTATLDTLPATLQPFNALKSHITIVGNLWNDAANAHGDGGGDHARGTAALLTCLHPLKSEATFRLGTSVDQVIANTFAGRTTIRSMQLGLEGGASSGGGCDTGYSCAYTNNISWADATTPLTKMVDPLQAFRQFVGQTNGDAAARVAALSRRQKIMDAVREDARRLETRLGSKDKEKLDQYLTSVDELDGRLNSQREQAEAGATCGGAAPISGGDVRTRVRAMIDVMVLAMQCDVSRVFTYMRGNGGSYLSNFAPGAPSAHHYISHYQENGGVREQYAAVNRWDAEQFAYLVQRLAETDDVEGKLIDNTLAFYSSEIGDGNVHNHDKMPVMLAGHAGGAIRGGRYVALPSQTPIANLYATFLQIAGAGASFGGSTGTISAL